MIFYAYLNFLTKTGVFVLGVTLNHNIEHRIT